MIRTGLREASELAPETALGLRQPKPLLPPPCPGGDDGGYGNGGRSTEAPHIFFAARPPAMQVCYSFTEQDRFVSRGKKEPDSGTTSEPQPRLQFRDFGPSQGWRLLQGNIR